MPVAARYSAAIDSVIAHGADNSKLFEMNADGSTNFPVRSCCSKASAKLSL